MMKSQKNLSKFDFRVSHFGFPIYVYAVLSENLQEKWIGSKIMFVAIQLTGIINIFH